MAPTIINSFAPAHGPYGANVTLTGTALQTAQSVQFGDGATAQPVTPPTNSTLMVAVPIGARSGSLTVNTPAGPITTDQTFTVDPPTITSFSPTSAPTGSTVTLYGTDLAEATLVRFGNENFVGVTVNADGSLAAVVPYGAASGPLTVFTPVGSDTSTQSFTYPEPTINDFSPTSGLVGTIVTISGTNLLGVTSVNFTGCGGISPSFNPDGTIWEYLPDCAQTGPISVYASYGTATSTQIFTVTS